MRLRSLRGMPAAGSHDELHQAELEFWSRPPVFLALPRESDFRGQFGGLG